MAETRAAVLEAHQGARVAAPVESSIALGCATNSGGIQTADCLHVVTTAQSFRYRHLAVPATLAALVAVRLARVAAVQSPAALLAALEGSDVGEARQPGLGVAAGQQSLDRNEAGITNLVAKLQQQ